MSTSGDALSAHGADLSALCDQGMALAAHGRPQEALERFERALRIEPRSAAVHINRGNALAALNRPREALESFEQAARLEPESALAQGNRGNALLALGRCEEALASLDRALCLAPGQRVIVFNRALALLALGRDGEALEALDHCVQLDPNAAGAWHHRGNALQRLRRHPEAVDSFSRTLMLDPRCAPALNNRGVAWMAMRQPDAALADFVRALRLRPEYPEALRNLAQAHSLRGEPDLAARALNRLLALAPDFEYAPGALLHARRRSCDWGEDCSELRARVAEGVTSGRKVDTPFFFLNVSESAAAQLQCARIYSSDKFPPAAAPLWCGQPYRHDRIRLAYVSADFHDHATARLAAGLFEHHDRRAFEVTAVSFGIDDGSAMRERLRRGFDRFVDVRARGDHDVAQLLRSWEIDIAVDLKGFTEDCRTGIFALRPAPVQVSYLGFPGTLGAPYMDYIIADRHVIPPDERAWYAEKVVHLPDSYQVNDCRRATPEQAPTRAEVGLPASGFVFCCFNSSYKITPEMFEVWTRVLHAVPGSSLWLLNDGDVVAGNLRREATARGIEPARLVFASWLPPHRHLARYALADLFLDTKPVNAHTTASDALWAGLPVLTCRGGAFAGRVAASLLHAAGVPELITVDLPRYEELAVALARDAGRLARLRESLAARRSVCALFDTGRYCRHLEAAFRAMWLRSHAGLGPQHLSIDESAAST